MFNFTKEARERSKAKKEELKEIKRIKKAEREKNWKINGERQKEFLKTEKVGYLLLDEKHKYFKMSKLGNFLESSNVFNYDELVNFEVREDGENIKKTSSALGRVAVGGVLLGGLGALAGATTAKNNRICKRLDVKFTVTGVNEGVYVINLAKDIKRGGWQYNQAVSDADKMIYEFEKMKAGQENV